MSLDTDTLVRYAEAVQAVRCGMQWLDTTAPTWLTKITPQELDMGICSLCVLGHVFGSYKRGMAVLVGLNPDTTTNRDVYESEAGVKAIELGFDAPDDSNYGHYYEMLTVIWQSAIVARIG